VCPPPIRPSSASAAFEEPVDDFLLPVPGPEYLHNKQSQSLPLFGKQSFHSSSLTSISFPSRRSQGTCRVPPRAPTTTFLGRASTTPSRVTTEVTAGGYITPPNLGLAKLGTNTPSSSSHSSLFLGGREPGRPRAAVTRTKGVGTNSSHGIIESLKSTFSD
jgi:hypothetical protein